MLRSQEPTNNQQLTTHPGEAFLAAGLGLCYTQIEMSKETSGKWPRHRQALAAIFAGFVILSLASSFSTRLKYGPDEPAHFIYIRCIAQDFRLPEISHRITPTEDFRATHQAQHAPLYYALAAIPFFVLERLGAGGETIWRAMRLFTIILGLGWVYFTYRLANEFFGGEYGLTLAATGVVAFLPIATYMSGVINNDVLVAALFTCALWMILAGIRRNGFSRKAAVWLGAVMGLAILTKAQGLTLVPTLLIAALVIARRNHWRSLRSLVGSIFISLGVAAALSGWWFVRNQLVYGAPMVQSLMNPMTPVDPLTLALTPSVWVPLVWFVSKQLFMYFWTPFWLLKPFVSADIYFVKLLVLCTVGLGGCALQMLRPRAREGHSGGAASYLILALPAAMIYALTVYNSIFVDRGLLQQGRIFLPMAACLAVWVASGYRRLAWSPKAVDVITAAVVLTPLMANIMTLYWIRLFYTIIEP